MTDARVQLAGVLCAFSLTAHAQRVGDVNVTFVACDAPWQTRFLRAAALEFEALPSTLDDANLEVACGEAIHLRVAQTEQRVERSAQAEVRGVALAAAEMLSAWDEARRLTARPPPPWIVALGGDALISFSDRIVRGGGSLQWITEPLERFDVDLRLFAGQGRASVADGDVLTRLVSLAATLGVRVGASPVSWTIGAGYRVSPVRWEGEPNRDDRVGRSGWTLWSGPLLGTRVTFHAGRVRVLLRLEGGYAFSPSARSRTRDVFSAAGPWLSGGIGVGLAR
ncbi:MAG: hypothetical protein AAGE52_30300 [Myxococcota bacterium]